MIGNLTVLGLIPARKNSKRLPSKNTLDLCGKPLIEWSCIAANESSYIDTTVLTSDDATLKQIAEKYNIDQPFIRPSELSEDSSTTEDVMHHAIEWLKHHRQHEYDLVVLLQPTSPFRTATHIDKALELFVKNPMAHSLVSISEVPHGEWLHTMDESGYLKEAASDEALVVPNGAIYIVRSSLFLSEKKRYTSKTLGYSMSKKVSVDIDFIDDLELANKYCDLLK